MTPAVKKAGIVLLVAAALLALLALFLYAKFDPETTPFPQCPFFWATGWKCPGCGSQRALHHLLHLQVGQAFADNACLVLFIPILAFLSAADTLRGRLPGLYRASREPVLVWSLLGLILLWWVLRNVFGW